MRKRKYIYAGETPLAIKDGPAKETIIMETRLRNIFTPIYFLELGEIVTKRDDLLVPEEERKLKSFIRVDIENHNTAQIDEYINAGNCIQHTVQYATLKGPEITAIRYAIPYKDPTASCFEKTSDEPIYNAINTQTDAQCELHCVVDNEPYERDIVIDIHTGGPGALNLLDVLEDVEDDIQKMAEDGFDGIFYKDYGEEEPILNVLFWNRETGEVREFEFERVRDFLRTIVSARLIHVENILRW